MGAVDPGWVVDVPGLGRPDVLVDLDGLDVDPGAEEDGMALEEDEELAAPAMVAGSLLPSGVMVPAGAMGWRGLAPAPPNWLMTAVASRAIAPMATTTWAGRERRARWTSGVFLRRYLP